MVARSGVPFAIHGIWGVKRLFTAKTNSETTDGSVPSLKYERNYAFTWQRWVSWILVFGVIGHVVQMRFVEAPKKIHINNEERFVVKVSDDDGLHSLAERIQVTLQKEGNQIIAIAPSPGKAMLLMVRDTFKSPFLAVLYSIFVLAAAFHSFNGLWTSLITWGMMLSYRSQKIMIPICWFGVGLLAFLGLAAIWGSYWINLRN